MVGSIGQKYLIQSKTEKENFHLIVGRMLICFL